MESKESRLWTMYEHGRSYQQSLGLTTQIPINVDFYEDRQWGNTKNLEHTKNYPRPVTNIIKMICRNKKAAVLSSPVRLVFKSNLEDSNGEEVTRFAEYIQRELKQEDLDNKAIDDGEKKGSYFYHYYWDAQAPGVYGEYEGGVRGEIIDPLNIYFANPREKDVQKQKWILISSREEVESVKKMADKGVDLSLITDDEEAFSDYEGEKEQEGSELCTVLTRYFRMNGEVYFERAVKATMLHKPRPLRPEAIAEEGEADAPEDGLPDKPAMRGDNSVVKANLYPVIAGVWETREGSIYGLSEIEGLISNQQAINRADAVKLLIGQSQSSSKIVAKEGALRGQTVTNNPMQVLTDYAPQGLNGIYTLAPGQVSPILGAITEQLIENTRAVSGSTEIMNGEIITSNMSGQAIMALQNQAQKPIGEIRDRFYQARERTGEVLVQFFKLFYRGKAYDYYDQEERAIKHSVFDGGKYRDDRFSVSCEAGAGSSYSDSITVSILQDLLNRQIIDAPTYIKQFPAGILPNKDDLVNALENQQQGIVEQLVSENEQLKSGLQRVSQIMREQSQTVDKIQGIIQENRKLKELLASLQAEYTEKINLANVEIQKMGGVA